MAESAPFVYRYILFVFYSWIITDMRFLLSNGSISNNVYDIF